MIPKIAKISENTFYLWLSDYDGPITNRVYDNYMREILIPTLNGNGIIKFKLYKPLFADKSNYAEYEYTNVYIISIDESNDILFFMINYDFFNIELLENYILLRTELFS